MDRLRCLPVFSEVARCRSFVRAAAQDLPDRYEAVEADVRDSVHLPRGAIRVGTPPAFGIHHLVPVVTRFAARYPDIEITVVLDDGRSNLLADALDLSIRIAPHLEDAGYIAYPLMKAPQVLVASPDYLGRAGAPRTVKELQRRNCLVHPVKSSAGHWRFAGEPPEDVRVRVRALLEFLKEWAQNPSEWAVSPLAQKAAKPAAARKR